MENVVIVCRKLGVPDFRFGQNMWLHLGFSSGLVAVGQILFQSEAGKVIPVNFQEKILHLDKQAGNSNH